jgi:predicted transcriptional regulator
MRQHGVLRIRRRMLIVMATTLRVSESTRARAAALAAATGESIGSVVDRALTAYERSEFWHRTAAALSELPAEPDEWDRTVRDGLTRD